MTDESRDERPDPEALLARIEEERARAAQEDMARAQTASEEAKRLAAAGAAQMAAAKKGLAAAARMQSEAMSQAAISHEKAAIAEEITLTFAFAEEVARPVAPVVPKVDSDQSQAVVNA